MRGLTTKKEKILRETREVCKEFLQEKRLPFPLQQLSAGHQRTFLCLSLSLSRFLCPSVSLSAIQSVYCRTVCLPQLDNAQLNQYHQLLCFFWYASLYLKTTDIIYIHIYVRILFSFLQKIF